MFNGQNHLEVTFVITCKLVLTQCTFHTQNFNHLTDGFIVRALQLEMGFSGEIFVVMCNKVSGTELVSKACFLSQ